MKGVLLGSRKHEIKIQENLGRFEETEIEGGFGKKGWRAEKCVCGCDVAINTSRDIFFRTVMGVACGHVCQKIKDGEWRWSERRIGGKVSEDMDMGESVV